MSMMQLLANRMVAAVAPGATVALETTGVQEDEAMEALVALIADYFGEGS